MPQSSHQSGDDERIDNYVCGRLAPEEQLEFEAEFIGNQELVKKIEEAYALKQCLVEAKKQGAFADSPASSWLEKWWHYFAIPQTAWGAVAAGFLLFPLVLFQINHHSSGGIESTSVYLPPDDDLRSASAHKNNDYVIKRRSDQVQIIFGVIVPPSSGKPEPWDIELRDQSERLIWSKQDQYGDARSMVYISIANNAISNGVYSYRVFSKEKKQVGSGIINIGD